MTVLDSRPAVSTDEQQHHDIVRAHQVLGEILSRVPRDVSMWRWVIGPAATSSSKPGIEAALWMSTNGHAARAALMGLAEQFGLDYSEKPHLGDNNIVAATGDYGGVALRFYDLMPPCGCGNCGGA